jgi:hypothetical protein
MIVWMKTLQAWTALLASHIAAAPAAGGALRQTNEKDTSDGCHFSWLSWSSQTFGLRPDGIFCVAQGVGDSDREDRQAREVRREL